MSGTGTRHPVGVGDASVRGDLSAALHREIVVRLRADPERVLRHARANLDRLRAAHPDGRSDPWFDRWEALLAGSVEELVAIMLDPGQDARDLRQSNPFAGVLTPRERWSVVRSGRMEAVCDATSSST